MRKLILAASAAFLLSPVAAEARSLETTYTKLYRTVAKEHGKRTPGRNIVRQGVRTKRGTREPSYHELGRSIRTFKRWLAPPVPPALASDRAPSVASAAAVQTGGKWAIPSYIVMRESGGNYGAYNANGCVTRTSRGCIGAYQIASFHFASGGACAGMGTSPAGQDRCAATLWNESGSSPWAQTR